MIKRIPCGLVSSAGYYYYIRSFTLSGSFVSAKLYSVSDNSENSVFDVTKSKLLKELNNNTDCRLDYFMDKDTEKFIVKINDNKVNESKYLDKLLFIIESDDVNKLNVTYNESTFVDH